MCFLLIGVLAAWRATDKNRPPFSVPRFLTAFATPFVVAEGAAAWLLAQSTSPLVVPVLMATGIIMTVYAHLMKAPTIEGHRIMDQIESLRRYIVRDPAEAGGISEAEYERLLTYAVALSESSGGAGGGGGGGGW